ncbi:MAG: class I SAM-dependent methyltransferase [Candidatus Electryoneaceae bacterium]|nr:class I SAM-dependent methyltransferase [Candidatus Electryoneaceae bacterium]
MPKDCLICGNNDGKIVFTEFGIGIIKCRHCGHIYSSYTTDQHYDEYFDDIERMSDDIPWWDQAHRAIYDDFCTRYIVNKSGKLLDAGCGLGFFVKKMREFTNWESFGYEISAPAVQFARDKLHLDNVSCGKVEESSYRDCEFDIITLWDVIEHLSQPDELLSYLHRILKPDGMLFIHTPNIWFQLPKARLKRLIKGMNHDIHYLEAKDHINIYSMRTISKLLQRNGFSKVRFTHLKPIQAVSGSESNFSVPIKNLWHHSSKLIFHITLGRINFNNLFVEAIK